MTFRLTAKSFLKMDEEEEEEEEHSFKRERRREGKSKLRRKTWREFFFGKKVIPGVKKMTLFMLFQRFLVFILTHPLLPSHCRERIVSSSSSSAPAVIKME